MIVSILAVVLAAAAFALVGYPLLRQRREQAPAVAMPDAYERALEDLVAQRDGTYAAIKELDFDQEMGNLVDSDHKELRERYRRKAAGILHDMDELQAVRAPRTTTAEAGPDAEAVAASAEDDIEREIRQHRRPRRRPVQHRPP